jgi:outer membrane protein
MKNYALALLGALTCLAATALPQQAPPRLSLDEARQIALANRPLVRAANLAVEGARQNTRQVQSARYPQLTANITAADAYRENTSQDGRDVTLDSRIAAGGLSNPIILRRESNGLYLSQLVTDFGHTADLVESARFAETSQRYQANATRAQVILDTSDAYFAALAAQSVLRVAEKTVEARRLLLDKISALARNKIKSDLDVKFAQVNLGEARLLLLRAENAVDAAFARLSTSLGYHDARRFTLADDTDFAPLGGIDALLDQAVAARPELASLRADRDAARKAAEAAKALNYPSINLYAAAGVTPAGDERLSRNYGAIGINLSLPLFDGGKISALQQQAQFRSLALSENLAEVQNNVLRSVRVAWLNARASAENIAITQDIRDAAAQVLSLAQSRYNLGITSIVELNQAQLSAIDAEIAYSRARYDYLAARAALDYEAGAFDLTGNAR